MTGRPSRGYPWRASSRSYDPLPHVVSRYLDKSGAVPIAITRHGQDLLAQAGFDSLYVPHLLDADIYRPLDSAECRATMELSQDGFVAVWIAANRDQGKHDRKGFIPGLTAWAKFVARHPEAVLVMHRTARGGIDLQRLTQELGIPLGSVQLSGHAGCGNVRVRTT